MKKIVSVTNDSKYILLNCRFAEDMFLLINMDLIVSELYQHDQAAFLVIRL